MKGKKFYIAAAIIGAALLATQSSISTCKASEPPSHTSFDYAIAGDTLKGKKFVYANSTEGYVNVRKQPTTQSEKLGELRNGGAGALYLSRKGEWFKVLYHGDTAYVINRYAQIGKPTQAPVENRYYYIVIGSFEHIEFAKKTADNLPDVMRRPVYRQVVGGKEKYRICESCFDSRDKAILRKKELDLRYGESDIWIWETRGMAECLYCPTSSREGSSRIKPLTPQ